MVRGKELHAKNVEHQSTKSRVAEFERTYKIRVVFSGGQEFMVN